MIEIYWGTFDIKFKDWAWMYLQYEREIPLPKKITYKWETIKSERGTLNCIPILKDNMDYNLIKEVYLEKLLRSKERKTEDIIRIERGLRDIDYIIDNI